VVAVAKVGLGRQLVDNLANLNLHSWIVSAFLAVCAMIIRTLLWMHLKLFWRRNCARFLLRLITSKFYELLEVVIFDIVVLFARIQVWIHVASLAISRVCVVDGDILLLQLYKQLFFVEIFVASLSPPIVDRGRIQVLRKPHDLLLRLHRPNPASQALVDAPCFAGNDR